MLLPVLLMVGCDSPRRAALRELEAMGVEPGGAALTQAVGEGDRQRVELLLEAGVHTEWRDRSGRVPLAVAVDRRDHEMVMDLVAAGADVNAECPDKSTVLGRAVRLDDGAMVSCLLAGGADGDGRVPGGEKILPWAIRAGLHEPVRALLEHGADPHMKDSRGDPLLHVAMGAGRRDLMETLIELGADPGTPNPSGQGTIEHALAHGWLDVVPLLAAAGGDPNAICGDGRTLLERAVAGGEVPVCSVLLRVGARPDVSRRPEETRAMLKRIRDDRESGLLEVFLDRGGIDREVLTGWFRESLEGGDIDLLRTMVCRGFRPDAGGCGGVGAVDAAVRTGEVTGLKLLLDYGFPADGALMTAIRLDDAEAAQVLLRHEPAVGSFKPPSVDTPLAAALRAGSDRVARVLLEEGADASGVPPEGQTMLHLAVATGCSRAVEFMLAHGADPNAPYERPVSAEFLASVRAGLMRWILKNDRRVTPLMVAADSGSVATAAELLQAGAGTNCWTGVARMWPINFASRRNDIAMMRLFLGEDPYREERIIEVDLSLQLARVFSASGKELFSTRVSTGKKGYRTPTGEFAITNKYRNWTSTLYDASMPYFQRLSCGDFGFHQGYVPKYAASHGCIRVPSGKAEKLFALTRRGDRVRIVP